MKLGATILAICFAACGPSMANQSFTDTEFNLSDYSITKFENRQTITVSRAATSGAPGAALQVLFSTQSGISSGNVVFINNNFIYDPAAEGSITSISFSSDNLIDSEVGVGSFGTNLLLLQEGNFYRFNYPLSTTENKFQHAQSTALRSSDFSLVTSFSAGSATIDSTLHPSFTSGVIKFGFDRAWNVRSSFSAHNTIERLDNFSVTVTSVPEATSSALALMGIAVVVSLTRKKGIA
jgi:hypothetical protein